jgi:DNA-binding MarR family transcriptional regulator
VDRLERLDYVERTTAPIERRKDLVRIKPKGVELVETIRHDMMESLAKVMETLSPHEQSMWVQIYEKIFNYCHIQTAACCAPSLD